jgi:anthranilate synthase component II
MKVGVIDNYDSFVYNLVRYIKEENEGEVIVQRNDAIDFELLETCDAILLSPGPGIPSEAGSLLEVIKRFSASKKILGICLGHQAIGEVFGGELIPCLNPVHGKMGIVQQCNNEIMFRGLPEKFETGRYHSWQLSPVLPEELTVTAVSENGEIMGVRHSDFDVVGVQFHPESILTPTGRQMIQNWLNN